MADEYDRCSIRRFKDVKKFRSAVKNEVCGSAEMAALNRPAMNQVCYGMEES